MDKYLNFNLNLSDEDLESFNRTKSKNEYAYQFIRREILNNRYPEGYKLNEIAIAGLLKDVSRTPVREAINRLCYEGFAEMIPGRGICVAGVQFTSLMEITESRIILEPQTVGLFIERAAEKDVQELVGIVAQHRAASEAKDEILCGYYDNCFHHLIGQGTRNRTLSAMIDDLLIRYLRGMTVSNGQSGDFENDHEEILKKILEKDSEAAKELMRGHFLHVREHLIKMQTKSRVF